MENSHEVHVIKQIDSVVKEIENLTKKIDELSEQIDEIFLDWKGLSKYDASNTIEKEHLRILLKRHDLFWEDKKQLRAKEEQIRATWNLELQSSIARAPARLPQEIVGTKRLHAEDSIVRAPTRFSQERVDAPIKPRSISKLRPRRPRVPSVRKSE